jgi:hypothetical protein
VKWQESKHSKAYEVLASDAAIAIGKEKGIDNPQTSDLWHRMQLSPLVKKRE